MKSAFLQCLAITALAVLAGGVYNTVNPNPEKRLPWLAKRYQGMEYLPGAPAPPVAEVAKPKAGKETGAGTGPAPEAGTRPEAKKTEEPPQAIEGVPLVDLNTTLEQFNAETLFIDARKPEEYEAGHIPGARSMFAHAGDLNDKIAQLVGEYPVEAPIVVYCTNSSECEDSKVVANQLKQVGFVNLMIFKGGFPEWKEKKHPIVTGKEPGKKEGQP